MGPLVPDIIGNELNLVIALFLGMLFGAVLEQAGFSTSKKLVGLFYGYDFTVLRVFFTAGVVAMTGVILLEHFGLLDINLTFVNPMFLWSAIVGGLIMGLGFVIGGFCPGTGLCAAAIGKIDGILFVLGSFIGVFIFAEGYPMFEGIYKGANWGNVQMYQTLHIPESLFAFLLTAVALTAFWFTSIVENKVNGVSKPAVRMTPYYVSLGVIGTLIAFSAFVLPEKRSSLLEKAEDINFVNQHDIKTISSDELAYRIIDKENELQIFDFRSAKSFEKFHLPKAISLSANGLFEKETSKPLLVEHKINVFVGDNELSEKKAAAIALELGFENIRVLQGGLEAFKSQIINFDTTQTAAANRQLADTFRFRAKACKVIPQLIEQSKSIGVIKKATKRVVGGC
ncbi:MAG: YeeE/YedE thiosulfate transporter family protein [Bacteroidota bacterium]|nr:YeeE/YedE thiosulfate transporter family protein [Bacteroidota bacterium]